MFRAVRAFLDQAPELRPWSLKFKDQWLERRFQDTYFDENIQYIRIATFLGAVTWAAFGPLALLVVDDEGGRPRLRDPVRARRSDWARQPRAHVSAELSADLAADSHGERSCSAGSSG